MSLTDELKPCPFCGCHGVKYIAHEYLRHTIKCEDCPGQMECYSSSKEQAIAAWNRRAIEAEATKPYANADSGAYGKEYTGQGAPVATKPQGPVHWRAVLCAEQVPQQLLPAMHVVGFRKFSDAESWVAAKLDFDGWRYTLEPLYTTPQPCPKCAELEAEVERKMSAAQFLIGRIKEREAERDALAITVQKMRESLEWYSNGNHIVSLHGTESQPVSRDELTGRGFDHVKDGWTDVFVETGRKAETALSLPDTSEIIKQHDASVLRKAAKEACPNGYSYGPFELSIRRNIQQTIKDMADELQQAYE